MRSTAARISAPLKPAESDIRSSSQMAAIGAPTKLSAPMMMAACEAG